MNRFKISIMALWSHCHTKIQKVVGGLLTVFAEKYYFWQNVNEFLLRISNISKSSPEMLPYMGKA